MRIKMSNTGHNINRVAGRANQETRAFTLIEVLVVIALTGLLLALVLGPLVQGFRLTNRARAYSAAQEATRYGIEQLRRELSQAAYVYDNTNAPIILPLGPDNDNNRRPDAADKHDPAMYPLQNGFPNPRPTLLFGKIDFILSATKGSGPDTVIDPTTDKPLGGTQISVPSSPGNRTVRYFVGLRNPLTADGKREFYRNVFEFPRADSDQNLFILYRAEFDPSDRNLIDQTQTVPTQSGGFNDPNFFYNLDAAPNGRSFAQNWKDTAVPVLATPNLDLIGWRRDSGRNLVAGSPFQLNANFAPSTVVSDTATPGFLTNANADAPAAVPTLYTAQNGLWTYPFTVTIYRAATQSKNGAQVTPNDPYGSMAFVVEQVQIPGTLATRLRVRRVTSAGSLRLQNGDSSYWWLYDPFTGKIFIHTLRASIQIDPARGRIETGFAPFPLNAGVPLYLPYGATPDTINLRSMVSGPGAANATEPPNVGSLFPLIFRQNTRCDVADRFNYYTAGLAVKINPDDLAVYVPTDQGILGTTLAYRLYYPANKPILPFTAPGQPYDSPFVTLGGASAADGLPVTNPLPFLGLIIAPGTETVLGPDNSLTADGAAGLMTTYYRIPAIEAQDKPTTVNTPDPVQPNDRRYVRTAPLNYSLSQDLGNFAAPVLLFDEQPSASSPDTAAGLPARSSQVNAPQGELRISYLWQNNYSRDRAGRPLNTLTCSTVGDPNGQNERPRRTSLPSDACISQANKTAEGIRPEADVLKLDYSTRALINVLLAPRVYDTSSGLPQSAQVNDKIAAGNVAR